MLYLKENGKISLQVACGNEVSSLIDEKGNLVLNTTDSHLFSTITEENNFQFLKKALAWQNFKGELIINKIKTQKDMQEEDFAKLNALGLSFKIIEGD